MAKASRDRLLTIAWRACAGALAALVLVLPVQAAGETGRKWQPHVDAVAKLGTQRKVGKLDVFLPLLQGQNGLLFADLRGVLTDDPSQEGNFGLGYRHIFRNNDWLYGADFALGFYAFYDRRRSLTDKIFNQATLGAEFLTVDWDFRVNGYIPQNQAKIVGFSSTGAGGVALVGTALFTTSATTVREQALPGFDIEAGRRLALRQDHELWLHAGYFRFARQSTIAVQGPRLRLEYRYDNPFGWRGARITLGGEARHDVVRRTDVFGVVRLRIPLDGLFFGGSRKTKPKRLAGIDRRMDEYVVRDTDVVSLAIGSTAAVTPGGAGSVPVTDAASGAPLNVFFVDDTGGGDCTQATPCTTAVATGSGDFGVGDVIVPLSATGTIAGNIALDAARQQIVGGGAASAATLVFTDAAASTLALAGLGARATLNGQVTLFLDANVRGFDIDNAGGFGMTATTNLGLASANVSDMGIRGSVIGVLFTGATGTANFAADVAVTGTAGGSAVFIDGGDGTVNFNGSITQNEDEPAVTVANRTGGTVTFSGPITKTGAGNNGILVVLNSGGTTTFSSPAISLNMSLTAFGVRVTQNTGATINFTGGGLNIVGKGPLFSAISGGTLNVTGAGHTVTVSAGVGSTGVRINGMTIGGSGVTFQSVTATGADDPIAVTNNGGTGTITFDAINITDSTADAVVLTSNVSPVVISGGTITNFTGDGVDISGSGNVTLNDLTITDANNTDFGVHFNNTMATVSGTGNTTAGGVTRCRLTGGAPTGTITIDSVAEPGGVC